MFFFYRQRAVTMIINLKVLLPVLNICIYLSEMLDFHLMKNIKMMVVSHDFSIFPKMHVYTIFYHPLVNIIFQ